MVFSPFDDSADWDVYELEEQGGVVFDVVLDVFVSEAGDEGDGVWVAVVFGIIVTNKLNYLQQLPIRILMIHQGIIQEHLIHNQTQLSRTYRLIIEKQTISRKCFIHLQVLFLKLIRTIMVIEGKNIFELP